MVVHAQPASFVLDLREPAQSADVITVPDLSHQKVAALVGSGRTAHAPSMLNPKSCSREKCVEPLRRHSTVKRSLPSESLEYLLNQLPGLPQELVGTLLSERLATQTQARMSGDRLDCSSQAFREIDSQHLWMLLVQPCYAMDSLEESSKSRKRSTSSDAQADPPMHTLDSSGAGRIFEESSEYFQSFINNWQTGPASAPSMLVPTPQLSAISCSLSSHSEGSDSDEDGDMRVARRCSTTKDVTQEQLREVYHLPIKAAAKKVGVSSNLLKKLCRQHGIGRWPYRKIHSLEVLRQAVELDHNISGDQRQAAIAQITADVEAVLDDPNRSIDKVLNDLRQVNYKQVYTVNKQSSMTAGAGAEVAAGGTAAGQAGGAAQLASSDAEAFLVMKRSRMRTASGHSEKSFLSSAVSKNCADVAAGVVGARRPKGRPRGKLCPGKGAKGESGPGIPLPGKARLLKPQLGSASSHRQDCSWAFDDCNHIGFGDVQHLTPGGSDKRGGPSAACAQRGCSLRGSSTNLLTLGNHPEPLKSNLFEVMNAVLTSSSEAAPECAKAKLGLLAGHTGMDGGAEQPLPLFPEPAGGLHPGPQHQDGLEALHGCMDGGPEEFSFMVHLGLEDMTKTDPMLGMMSTFDCTSGGCGGPTTPERSILMPDAVLLLSGGF